MIPSPVDALSPLARDLYEPLRSLPIVSPHGHCDPAWFAEDKAFADPTDLLIRPDHYVFRMLYSQGIALEDLGIGQAGGSFDPRKAFQKLADHWHCFLGTPSRLWMNAVLKDVFGWSEELTPRNAMAVYDLIDAALKTPDLKPRALFDRFNIEVLATTDGATDNLNDHQSIRDSDWSGRIIPTFRPDSVLNPHHPDFLEHMERLAHQTDTSLDNFGLYLDALKKRRAFFRTLGATATDHDVPDLQTEVLDPATLETFFSSARKGELSRQDGLRFYNHMLIEMARLSCEDGMVMQLHVGSRRSTNEAVSRTFGADKGADIPHRVDWVHGMHTLLNQVGNNDKLHLLVFTLDEAAYARELAPMAGHWPALKLGPPWWFHDSLKGFERYFDSVVETAGYYNLAGFNDDTRAFLSIPARHDLWRLGLAKHLAQQVEGGQFSKASAAELAVWLAVDAAKTAYKLS